MYDLVLNCLNSLLEHASHASLEDAARVSDLDGGGLDSTELLAAMQVVETINGNLSSTLPSLKINRIP